MPRSTGAKHPDEDALGLMAYAPNRHAYTTELAKLDPNPTSLRLVPPAAPVCHGYANCCRCPDCTELERQIAEHGFTPGGKIATPQHRPRQPWDVRPARQRAA